jgi:hypothetical protein
MMGTDLGAMKGGGRQVGGILVSHRNDEMTWQFDVQTCDEDGSGHLTRRSDGA